MPGHLTLDSMATDPFVAGDGGAAEGGLHLVLMRIVADDRFGEVEKPNAAWTRAMNGSRRIARFDSVSNAFPEAHYRHVAGLSRISLHCEAEGEDWLIVVMRADADGGVHEVLRRPGSGRMLVRAGIALAEGGGRLWAELHHRGDAWLHDLCWTIPRPPRVAALPLAITTYDKPGYLSATLQAIRASGVWQAGLIDLMVVNNGGPIPPLPDGARQVDLPNLGGTGGFRAALADARARDAGHFVIMDDDIRLHPDYLQRVFALSCLTEGVHLGALAELLHSPERRIKEQGADYDAGTFLRLAPLNPGLALTGPGRAALYQVRAVDYSGWWALMVDLRSPVPPPPLWLFLKRDDIGFGLASAHAGVPTHVFPNLLVAHADEGAALYLYFDIRNDIVLRLALPGLGIGLGDLTRYAWLLTLTLRREMLALMVEALGDVLRGPAHLARLDHPARVAGLRPLMPAAVPIPADAPVLVENRQGRLRRLLAFLLPAGTAQPPVIPAPLPETVGALGAYLEPVGGGQAILRRRSPALLWLFARALALSLRLRLGRKRLAAAYAAAFTDQG